MRSEPRHEKRMATGVEHRADSRERRADLRVVGDINHVASERETESSAEACALHRRKGRRRKRDDSFEQWIEGALDYRFRIFIAGVGVGEIASRAECRSLTANQQRAHALRRGAIEA